MRTKQPAEINLSFLAGLYTRVAKQAGVHPSYVSRVARGERRSERVSRAIADELARFTPSSKTSKNARPTASTSQEEYRQRLVRRLQANPQLTKLSAMVLDLEDWGNQKPSQVSRVSLQSRIAANAAMIAASMEQFDRLSRKLENFDYVLGLTDQDGIVLYSQGSTGIVREQGCVPGANWGRDAIGASAAARAIAAAVPLIIVGKADSQRLLPVRMGCPIRLGDGEVAGAVVLSIALSPARAGHLLDMAKAARRICRIVEAERKRPSRRHPRSRVQRFVEAEVHLAQVMSLPQIDPNTRAHLATMLSSLEEQRRKLLLHSRSKRKQSGSAKAQGV